VPQITRQSPHDDRFINSSSYLPDEGAERVGRRREPGNDRKCNPAPRHAWLGLPPLQEQPGGELHARSPLSTGGGKFLSSPFLPPPPEVNALQNETRWRLGCLLPPISPSATDSIAGWLACISLRAPTFAVEESAEPWEFALCQPLFSSKRLAPPKWDGNGGRHSPNTRAHPFSCMGTHHLAGSSL